MTYLTSNEYERLGFDEIDNFEQLEERASSVIDLYTDYFYSNVEFESDNPIRKNAVKRAVAYQINYMDTSGITTAEDKASLNSLSIGRTTINYSNNTTNAIKDNFNLSQDTLNLLNSVGFGYKKAIYDR
uniref:Head Tail Connector Protein n=1 Tax=Siphoviridae sp. ctJjf17 TaxID=2827839 RepID=A0A8S5SA37_9CAUD|nr:MAG TPA: Putative Head Tail Connector Protein [Siphoviridae sp. ctJjf17]